MNNDYIHLLVRTVIRNVSRFITLNMQVFHSACVFCNVHVRVCKYEKYQYISMYFVC